MDIDKIASRVASEVTLFQVIRHGDRVTIVTPQGQKQVGKAVMRGPAGWVLNMGGRSGTPAIANEDNIVEVNGYARGSREARVEESPTHKNFDSKKEALEYLEDHGSKSVGWMEGTKEKTAIYWNGKRVIMDAQATKRWAGSLNFKLGDRVTWLDPITGKTFTGTYIRLWHSAAGMTAEVTIDATGGRHWDVNVDPASLRFLKDNGRIASRPVDISGEPVRPIGEYILRSKLHPREFWGGGSAITNSRLVDEDNAGWISGARILGLCSDFPDFTDRWDIVRED